VPVNVPVNVNVPAPYNVPVPYEVEKIVPVSVDVPYEVFVNVPQPYERVVQVERAIPVAVNVPRPVEVSVPVPVEVVRENIVENRYFTINGVRVTDAQARAAMAVGTAQVAVVQPPAIYSGRAAVGGLYSSGSGIYTGRTVVAAPAGGIYAGRFGAGRVVG